MIFLLILPFLCWAGAASDVADFLVGYKGIVGIGGCPGVGKSYFTNELGQELNQRGSQWVIVGVDDFILTPEERRKIGTEWDIRHLKVEEVHDCLKKIYNGEQKVWRAHYYRNTGKIEWEWLDLTDVDLVLFEGLYAISDKVPIDFFKYCLVGIYIDADEEDIYDWKWKRELEKTTPRTPEQFVKHMDAIFTDFHENVACSKKNALFIIHKDHEHHYQLERSDASTSLLE